MNMPDKPRTFSEKFCTEDASLFKRLGRDIRLLRILFMVFVGWFKARKIRAEFKRCRETNQPFYVDRFALPTSPKTQSDD